MSADQSDLPSGRRCHTSLDLHKWGGTADALVSGRNKNGPRGNERCDAKCAPAEDAWKSKCQAAARMDAPADNAVRTTQLTRRFIAQLIAHWE